MKTFQLLTSGLLAAMLLTGCGGGGGDSTGVSACSDFSGTWLAMSGSYTIQSCSGTKKDVTGASLTITQQGCTVSWQQPDWDGTIQNWSGIAQGKVLHIVNNLVDHSGITTTETLDVNINDGILTGDSSWKYGNGACSGLGQSHFTATRLTTPTVTTTTVTTPTVTTTTVNPAYIGIFKGYIYPTTVTITIGSDGKVSDKQSMPDFGTYTYLGYMQGDNIYECALSATSCDSSNSTLMWTVTASNSTSLTLYSAGTFKKNHTFTKQ